jgi:hypothetical protein
VDERNTAVETVMVERAAAAEAVGVVDDRTETLPFGHYRNSMHLDHYLVIDTYIFASTTISPRKDVPLNSTTNGS